MTTNAQSLWQILEEKDVVHGEAPALEKLDSPWYIKFLLAFSGWLAALFLMLFIGFSLESFIRESPLALALVGAAMIGVAYWLFCINKNEFSEHTALALSLAGQALIAWFIFDVQSNNAFAIGIIAAFELTVALLLPNYLHRLAAGFIAAGAFSISLSMAGWPYVGEAILLGIASALWLNEFNFPKFTAQIRAIAYGLTFAIIPLKGSAIFGHGTMTWSHEAGDLSPELSPWLGEILIGMVFIGVILQLCRRQQLKLSDKTMTCVLLGGLMLCLLSFKASGITLGMTILLLGFSAGNRLLTGLGIMSLLFFSSSYYYFVDIDLLNKAGILLATGVFLLAARWIARQLLRPSEQSHNPISRDQSA